MKITVEHEIPDEEDCGRCIFNDAGNIHCSVTFCETFRCSIKLDTPCPACMEARKKEAK